jgi:16S rRNA (uracil1498-N3)-methyltransferase
MHRCLVTTEQLLAETCALGRDEARHLKTVLRIKPGANVTLFDGHGRTRIVVVAALSKDSLVFSALEPVRTWPPPPCRITLFACVSKGGRMDWTVAKAVELGAFSIVPVISERTVVRLDDAGEGVAKAGRWSRVAEEAARQCQAVWLPEIHAPVTFAESLRLVEETAPVFVAALTPSATPLRQALADYGAPPARAGWFVGPEGDFTPAELQSLLDAGAIPVSLGSHVLRTETACLYGLCALSCAWL